MSRKRRGISLIDGLVGLALGFLLALSIHQVVIPSFRLVQENQIYTELQQQGQLTLKKLVEDLQGSIPTAVSLAIPGSEAQPMIVASQPISQADLSESSSLLLMTQLQLMWRDPALNQIFRQVYHQAQPVPINLNLVTNSGQNFIRSQLEAVIGSTNNTRRSYAKSVTFFRVEKEFTSGGEVYACRIGLEKDIPNKPNKKARVELYRKVMLRNHQ